jgi:hypothetical protein
MFLHLVSVLSATARFLLISQDSDLVEAEVCALSEGLVVGFSVGLLNDRECSFPKTLNSALPSFSTSLVHKFINSGVAAISAISAISPG